MVVLPFQNRTQAGRLAGAELASRKLGANTLVLALPRGGVAVGVEVAEALQAPLDVVVVRKIGVPWQPELAMGAMARDTQILDRQLIRQLRITDEDVKSVVARETAEMDRREQLYRGGLPPIKLQDRTVVLVDDGLATGQTMVAAARYVRGGHPRKIVMAVPVASPQAFRDLQAEVDECVCLTVPRNFVSVGRWYIDFRQLEDSEVQDILKRSHSACGAGG
jgi:putative phosphoribosyl transferase